MVGAPAQSAVDWAIPSSAELASFPAQHTHYHLRKWFAPVASASHGGEADS